MVAAGIAGTLSLVAYGSYNVRTCIGESHPNISSWAVWALLSILNFTSYRKVTGSWIKSLLPTANAIMCIVTFLCVLKTGLFRPISSFDAYCFLMGCIAVFMWLFEKTGTLAQIMLQIANFIGFIPTFIATYHHQGREPWNCWLLWTLAFTSQFIAVNSNWKGKYIEFLYPVMMIICHGIVFVFVVR